MTEKRHEYDFHLLDGSTHTVRAKPSTFERFKHDQKDGWLTDHETDTSINVAAIAYVIDMGEVREWPKS